MLALGGLRRFDDRTAIWAAGLDLKGARDEPTSACRVAGLLYGEIADCDGPADQIEDRAVDLPAPTARQQQSVHDHINWSSHAASVIQAVRPRRSL